MPLAEAQNCVMDSFYHEEHEEHLGGVVAGPVYYIPQVLFVVNPLRPPVLLRNRHPSHANRIDRIEGY